MSTESQFESAHTWWIRTEFDQVRSEHRDLVGTVGTIAEKVDALTTAQTVALALSERRARWGRWVIGGLALLFTMPQAIAAAASLLRHLP